MLHAFHRYWFVVCWKLGTFCIICTNIDCIGNELLVIHTLSCFFSRPLNRKLSLTFIFKLCRFRLLLVDVKHSTKYLGEFFVSQIYEKVMQKIYIYIKPATFFISFSTLKNIVYMRKIISIVCINYIVLEVGMLSIVATICFQEHMRINKTASYQVRIPNKHCKSLFSQVNCVTSRSIL